MARTDPRFSGLVFPASIEIANASSPPAPLLQEHRLDAGELAALALAVEQRIDNILMDERAGRAVALTLGLRPSGLLGILIRARKLGLIPAVLPLLDQLQNGARFRISPALRSQVAVLTDEH